MKAAEFRSLLERLAAAWAAQDAAAAAACFSEDATYIEPPDEQYFHGHEELLAYFSPLEPGTYLAFRHTWFDEGGQTGAVEFSFGVEGRESADHGVAVVELRDGLIHTWREYVRQGPADFERFTGTDGKSWRWDAGNYP
jgi:ketosteroid isomerase-like protein